MTLRPEGVVEWTEPDFQEERAFEDCWADERSGSVSSKSRPGPSEWKRSGPTLQLNRRRKVHLLEQVAVEPAAPEGSAFPGMEKARNTLVKVLKDI